MYLRPLCLILLAQVAQAALRTYRESALFNQQNQDTAHSVVVDAGSSSSRAYVYERKERTDQVFELYDNEVSPGIQDVSTSDLSTYLANLLSSSFLQALNDYGVNQAETPLRFYGTAGMRSVNARLQNQTWTSTAEWIESHYNFTDIQVKTISGQQEALYGFISGNVLSDTLENPLASFDLGGGSAEIAYRTQQSYGPGVYNFSYGTLQYTVGAQTWLGQGNDWSRLQVLDYVGSFPVGYPFADDNLIAGDFDSGQYYMESEILQSVALPAKPVANQGMRLLSSYYYQSNALVYQNNGPSSFTPFSIDGFRKAAETYCTSPWPEINSDPVYMDDNYSDTYCTGIASGLLSKVDAQQFGDLFVGKKINGTSVSWSQGVAWMLLTGASFTELPASTPENNDDHHDGDSQLSPMATGLIIGGIVAVMATTISIAIYLAKKGYCGESPDSIEHDTKGCCNGLFRNRNGYFGNHLSDGLLQSASGTPNDNRRDEEHGHDRQVGEGASLIGSHC